MVIPECSPASATRTQNSERPRRQHAYDRSRNSDGSDSSLRFWFLHDRLGRMVLQIPKTTRHLPLSRQEQLISRVNRLAAVENPPEAPRPPKPVNPQTETTPFPLATYPCPTSTPQPATIEVDPKSKSPGRPPGLYLFGMNTLQRPPHQDSAKSVLCHQTPTQVQT